MRIRRPLLGITTVALLVLAGCGDDDGSDETGVTGTGNLSVELTDFAFAPDTIEAAAGETYTVALENTGAVAHTFTTATIDKELRAGDSTSVDVTVPADGGQLEFYCRFHRAGGMTGAFVTSGAPTDDSRPAGGLGY